MLKISELLEHFREKRQQFLEDLQREYDILKKKYYYQMDEEKDIFTEKEKNENKK
jgi:hypothetical protein